MYDGVMRRLPPLSSLRAFEAAARHGSFKAAADELGVTATAISHQIRTLEEHLGRRLFERKTRQVVLRESGRSLFVVLRDGFDAFAQEVSHIRAEQGRAVVTISATAAFTTRWLVPRIALFQAAHPGINLRLHASDAVVDLHAAQADIAIRYGHGSYPGMVTHKLVEDVFAPVANPTLGMVTPADLLRVPLVHFEWRHPDPANPTWDLWLEQAGIKIGELSSLRFSEETNAIQAAVAGQGLALLSLLLVKEELTAGRLVQPFGPCLPGFAYHAVMLPGPSQEEHVRLACEWLRAQMADEEGGPAHAGALT